MRKLFREAVSKAMKAKTEVGDAEEVEPVGSTPVKTRTKKRVEAMVDRIVNRVVR